MKKIWLPFLTAVVLSGCFNERGVSLRYYNSCEEYYDVQGYYHKRCDKNLIDYSEVKSGAKSLLFITPDDPKHGSVE